MPMNDAVNASHGEFIDASEELEALRNVYVLTGMVLERDIRTIAKGAHKLRKAAALLDVFAHSLATVRAERDALKIELQDAQRYIALFYGATLEGETP